MERKMSDEEYLRLSMKARRGSLTVEEHQAYDAERSEDDAPI